MPQLTTDTAMKINQVQIGNERAPLLVVDNFIQDTSSLINAATKCQFEMNSPFYPGIRAPVPVEYQQTIIESLGQTLADLFSLPSANLCFPVCHYSIVTTPPNQLKLLQRIPHFDSLEKNGLAAVHYLFKGDLGGTSFYRHRKTGFESIDDERKASYFSSLENENAGPNLPKIADGYINGDTPLYEKIAEQAGVFNRLIIYRRNSLHSGSIKNELFAGNSPIKGRLTINSFIDCV